MLFRKFCRLELGNSVPEASTLGRFRTALVTYDLWDVLLLGDEKALYADAAYSSQETRDKLTRLGIDDQVQRKGYRDHPLSDADKRRNAQIALVRSGAERPFATYKRLYGLGRTRLMGLAKNVTFYGLAAIASNIRKGAKFLTLYGLADSVCTG